MRSESSDLDTEAISTLEETARAHLQNGNIDLATQNLQKIISVDPDNASANHLLGVISHQRGDNVHAEFLINKALKKDPKMLQAYNNLGAVLIALGKLKSAKQVFLNLIKNKPDYADAYANLGVVYKRLGALTNAINTLKKSIELKPNHIEAYNALGATYRSVRKIDESIRCYQKVIALAPNYPEAYNNLGNAIIDLGRHQEAIQCFKKALMLNPKYTDAYSNLLLTMNYIPLVSNQEICNQHCNWEKSLNVSKVMSRLARKQEAGSRKQEATRIRVGYVSPDFHEHPVAAFLMPLLSSHDRKKFKIFAYYNNSIEDEKSIEIKKCVESWQHIETKNDNNVASVIKKDGIDLLIDLAGHTAGNRLGVFALNPAPIQITWLGYPNTTGLSNMDYRLTDEVADPTNIADSYYSEKLIRLKHGFLCFQGSKDAINSLEIPATKNAYITFGSFNNLRKITSIVLRSWAKILLAVPNSKLILKSMQLQNEGSKQAILSRLVGLGVNKNRIVLHSVVASTKEHLELYNQIDIGLDTFPYNGTTTTLEALWMGVPVITLEGDRHAARVGMSIMQRIGLNNLVASDEDNYVKKAVKLSKNLTYLQKLKSSLRNKTVTSDLCNAEQFTSELEKTYLGLVHKHFG